MNRHSARNTLLLAAIVLAGHTATAGEPTKQECVAANSSAQDLRAVGKLRAAREKLALCVSTSCPGPVREDCAQRLDEVNKAMPSLVFEAKDEAGNDLAAVRVTMDGVPLAGRLDGTSLAVDPGEHVFRFETNSFTPVEKRLVVHQTEKDRRVALSFRPSSVPAPSGNGSSDATGNSPPLWPEYLAFGVSGVGLVLGIIFTASALNQNSTLAGECTMPNGGCDPKYQSQIDALHQDQILATVGYGIAVVGAGIGTYLLLTSKASPPRGQAAGASGARVVPRIGVAWLGVGGEF
jgi:hypothetical protein